MQYKNVSDSSVGGIIKDIDTKTGTVTGYFSVFGNVDSDGDMIMPGAFKRTLQNNYNRQKHLNQHNPLQVLAGTKKGNLIVKEDSKGLYFESRIGDYSYAKDTILAYERGDIDEHSIGFNTVKQQKASSYNELLEIKLWEGSTVTWGANPNALSDAKSMTKAQQANVQIQEFLKAFKAGEIDPEEVCDTLELTFKQLQQHILDLSTQPATLVAPDPLVQKTAIDTNAIAALLALKTHSITI
jgi:HK97 family phage prohead protease